MPHILSNVVNACGLCILKLAVLSRYECNTPFQQHTWRPGRSSKRHDISDSPNVRTIVAQFVVSPIGLSYQWKGFYKFYYKQPSNLPYLFRRPRKWKFKIWIGEALFIKIESRSKGGNSQYAKVTWPPMIYQRKTNDPKPFAMYRNLHWLTVGHYLKQQTGVNAFAFALRFRGVFN